ncbi:MAG: hypothetical protein KF729_37460 [Sandaracinaceae bacterium]|nr:hypothetical protein [Sandaracinaceae bacterium]
MARSGARRPLLPVLGAVRGDLFGEPPTLDEARAQLGGPWIGGPDIGSVVRVVGGAVERVGVVVHATPTDRDVWIGAGRVQRVEPARLVPAEASAEHDAIVADARLHASLSVGDEVSFEGEDGAWADGVLVEKLRFGALVGVAGAEHGKVVAIGFRRIAPREAGPAS